MRQMVKNLTIEQMNDGPFMKGLNDGQHGRAFDPRWNWCQKDRDSYRAGFTLAREQPRC